MFCISLITPGAPPMTDFDFTKPPLMPGTLVRMNMVESDNRQWFVHRIKRGASNLHGVYGFEYTIINIDGAEIANIRHQSLDVVSHSIEDNLRDYRKAIVKWLFG